jgi:hypothetical protein
MHIHKNVHAENVPNYYLYLYLHTYISNYHRTIKYVNICEYRPKLYMYRYTYISAYHRTIYSSNI